MWQIGPLEEKQRKPSNKLLEALCTFIHVILALLVVVFWFLLWLVTIVVLAPLFIVMIVLCAIVFNKGLNEVTNET